LEELLDLNERDPWDEEQVEGETAEDDECPQVEQVGVKGFTVWGSCNNLTCNHKISR